MTDPKTIAECYLAVWNERDDASRRTLMRETWSADATYVDPLMTGSGLEEISTMIEHARAQFPGHRFVLAGAPDGYGDHVRFSWTLVSAGGTAAAAGTDMARLDRQGRIAAVIGFLNGMLA